MTDDAPTSEPATPAESGQPFAAELLASSALPATTAMPAAAGPKLPPYSGD